MKRVFFFILPLSIALYSCTIETMPENSVKTFDNFEITIESSNCSDSTKATLYESTKVKWVIGDAIGIYSDQQAPVKYVMTDDGKWRGEPVTGTSFYAYYPYNEGTYDSTNPYRLQMNLNGNLPMVAKGNDNKLMFKQTVGLLHFKIKSSHNMPFASIRENNGETNLFGEGYIKMDENSPILILNQGEFNPNQAVFSFRCDTQIDTDGRYIQDYYFLVPEQVFENGFEVQFFSVVEKDENGNMLQFTKRTNKACHIQRGVIKSYKMIDVENETQGIEEDLLLEREALIALYNALDGPNWTNNTNWCSEWPLGEWYGVDTDNNGRVRSITLPDNNLNGVLPDIFSSFPKLQVLWLPNNLISGNLPESIGSLEEMFSIELSDNRLIGTIPDSYRNLKSLRNLYLRGYLTEDFEQLDFDYLNGPLPEWIGELTNLRSLELSNNKFSGPLPETLSNLVNLDHLLLNGNLFSGPFPEGLSSLVNLADLNLGGNLFSGSLPEGVSNLVNLVHLVLSDNSFSGPLPDLSSLSELADVGLDNNYFTGSIPSSFATVLSNPKFRSLTIGMNCLSGAIPLEIWNHPHFPCLAGCFLQKQRDGYGLIIDENKVPACRHIFETFDESMFDLGAQYSVADYTMIIRWAEWCPNTKVFLPKAINLAKKYKDKGLQTIWSYDGGEDTARKAYMQETGLDQMPHHIVEFYHPLIYDKSADSKDHAIWEAPLIGTPFVEIVNKDGNIVFVEDYAVLKGIVYRHYDQYSFSHKRDELESFLAQLFDEELYESTDYSADGKVHTIQTATKGAGINVVLMGDAFSDRLIADGTYENVMRSAANALFSEDPYKSFKDYFNVYYVDVVSKNEVFYGKTTLSTWYGEGTTVGGDDGKVVEYATRVLKYEQIMDALMIVMMNRDHYAGTCYMYSLQDGDYGRGPSVAYFPTSSDSATFDGLVSHEAGGHGFAKLADEYAYQNMGAVTQDVIDNRSAMFPYGWWRNGDFTGDPTQVKWSQFISDSRYEAENIGTYEGAFTYWTGAWRPTEDSIMNHNVGGFNAPSRYAIWYRINKLAYGPEWQGTYEDFVEFDKPNRTPEAIAKRKAQRRNYVEKDFVPLAPPVVIKGDWREIKEIR